MPLISTLGSAGAQSFGNKGLILDGSAEFNATGDRFSFPQSAAFNYGTGPFTIEMWMYPTSNTGGTRVIWRQETNIYLCMINGGQLYWATGAGNFAIAAAPTLFAWNHIAVVRIGNSVSIYLNGVRYSAVTSNNFIGTPSTIPVLGNYTPTNNQFLGYITNFRIAKQALYTTDFTPSLTSFTRTSQGAFATSLLMNMRNASTLTTDSSISNLTITNTNVTFSPLSPYRVPYAVPPTVVVISAFVNTSTTTPREGETITVFVNGTNTPNGTYYYTLQEELATGALDTADFTSGSLSGSFTINSNSGSFPITVTADLLTEGNETFTIYVRQTSTSGTIIGTSSEITITDSSLTPAFTVTPASVNEGSSASFTVQNVGPNGTYFWTVLNGTSAAADFDAVSGSFVVSGSTGGLDNGTGSFSVPVSADRVTEGSQTFQVQVRSGSIGGTIVATSSSVTINDISLTPAFTVTPTNILQDASGSFTVNNLGPAGTYYWTVLNDTSTDTDFVSPSGSFTTSTLNGSGSFNITTALVASGPPDKTFQVQIRSGSTSGTVIVTSSTVTIQTITISYNFTKFASFEGDSIGLDLLPTANTPAGTYEVNFEAFSGSVTSADFNTVFPFNVTISPSVTSAITIFTRTGDGAEAQQSFRVIVTRVSTGQEYTRTLPVAIPANST